ncbi:HNH endonuclease [Silicimonas algicola]|uniref:HNH endonuclease n=1 Tax=Silicimonas algicola TaxID=1826607 RepID=UPI0011B26AE0|nr:HNH endonuclease [Silicimonas algicola]
MPGDFDDTFHEVGVCLYCRENPDGSVEHVLPEALNGRIKLRNATCIECKKIINSEFEGPLLGYFWKEARNARGYRNKKRGRGSKIARAVPGMTITITRKVPPFKEIRPSQSKGIVTPIMALQLQSPSFLGLDDRKTPSGSKLNIHSGSPVSFDHINKEQAEVKASDPNIVKVSHNFPGTKAGLIHRLVLKVGCGLLWFFWGQEVPERVRALILNGGDLLVMDQFAKSAPREAYEIANHEAHTFTAEEDGEHAIYVAFTLLPEVIDRVFFFRAGTNECELPLRISRLR